MGKMQEMTRGIRCDCMSQLLGLRRVPTRYRQILPLKVMKQYQCVAVGAAQGVLTVAITNRYDNFVIECLSMITRRTIFPVCVDLATMRRLIQHTEREERYKHSKLRFSSFLHPHQTRTLMILLPHAKEKQR